MRKIIYQAVTALGCAALLGCGQVRELTNPGVTTQTPATQSPAQATPTAKEPTPTNQSKTTKQPNAPKTSLQASVRVIPDERLSPQIVVAIADKTYTLNAKDIQVEVLDSLDCQSLRRVEKQTLTASHFIRDTIAIDPGTGRIAVGVIFQYCALNQESAVLVLRPTSPGNYRPQILQVPGRHGLSAENATHPLGYISTLNYRNGNLLVKHVNADNSEAELVFQTSPSSIGVLVNCNVISGGESGGQKLCPPKK